MKIKKYFHWMTVAAIVGLMSSFWLLVQSNADDPKPGNQIFLPLITTDDSAPTAPAVTARPLTTQAIGSGGRIDAFTFYVPFPADIIDDQLERGVSDDNGVNPPRTVDDFINQPVVTTISIAVHRNDTIIYYDQWEDGYEVDLTFPTQTSTLVWGDNDPTNGVAPGFPANDPPLQAGDIITLQNPITLPRDSSQARFDGGDTFSSVGGSIAVSTMFWPASPGVLYADAWELYPTSRWGTNFRIPIGEDLYRYSSAPFTNDIGPFFTNSNSFDVVGLYVQAVQDNTTVNIDLNNDGVVDRTGVINQGETFGVAPGNTQPANPANLLIGVEGPPTAASVLAGARVQTDRPVQVTVTAINSQGRWEQRGYTMVPEDQWVGDYMYPRSSDGEFWLFNPGGGPLTVNVAMAGGATDTVTIPANSTVRYLPYNPNPPALKQDINLLSTTGIRFTASQPFYGVAAFDSGDSQDWGSALIPFQNLTTQVLVGLGPSNANTPPNRDQSPIYVTVATNTTIHVDLNNDGVSDCDVPVAALDEVGIVDGQMPANPPISADFYCQVAGTPGDGDMTGAFLYTDDGTPFIAVWGQAASATRIAPSIDAGTSIAPLPALSIQKTFDLILDQDCNGAISVNDTLRFKLDFFSNAARAISNVQVEDDLTPALQYVLGTTTLNGQPRADGGGSTPFILDEGGINTGTVNPRSVGSITFDTVVNNTAALITNQAIVTAQLVAGGTDDAAIVVPAGSASPVMEISTALVDPTDGVVSPGQTITVSLTITNVGSLNVETLPVQYSFTDADLSFAGASISPDSTAAGLVTWNDLTATLGDLAPGQAANIVLNFTVDRIPPGNSTSLAALIAGAKRENSPILLRCRSDASPSFFAPPTPTPTPGPTATERPPHNGNPQSTPASPPPASNPPTPTPTPAVVAAAVPAATPTGQLPVLFLPETGLKEGRQPGNLINILVVLVGGTAGGSALWQWQKTKRAKSSPPGKKK